MIINNNKIKAIAWAVIQSNIDLKDLEKYLRSFQGTKDTWYRKLLCIYDFKKYA